MSSTFRTRVVGIGGTVAAVLVVGYLIKKYLPGRHQNDSTVKPRRKSNKKTETFEVPGNEDSGGDRNKEGEITEQDEHLHIAETDEKNNESTTIIRELEASNDVKEKFVKNETVFKDRENQNTAVVEEIIVPSTSSTENTEAPQQNEQVGSSDGRTNHQQNEQVGSSDGRTNHFGVNSQVKSEINNFVKTVISESVKIVTESSDVNKTDSGISLQSGVGDKELNTTSLMNSQCGEVKVTPEMNTGVGEGNHETGQHNGVRLEENSKSHQDQDMLDLRMEDDSGRFSHDEITDALLVSQNSPGLVSSRNAEVLVSLLGHPDSKLQTSALNGIIKCSAFQRNQDLLREHGCLLRLSKLLRIQSMSLRSGVKPSQKLISSVATAITNLSANNDNNKQLEDCVPTLVDLTLEDETGESVCLSSLQALTNLSVTPQHHGHYTRVVQRLYDLLNTDKKTIRLQSLKVLANLSCNIDMVPHLLAAKAPDCVYDFLKQGTDEAILLRWTTILANILHTVKEKNITASSLPCDDKAPSPETMYSALLSMNSLSQIKSKVFLLCRHRNQDIQQQATKIHHSIAR